MGAKYKRRKLFIHPSSQLKYIAFSIVPALLLSLYCTFFLIHSGSLVLRAAKEKPLVPVYAIRQGIASLEKEGYTKDIAAKATRMKSELDHLLNILEESYVDTLAQWNKTKQVIFAVLFCVILFVGFLSLLYSHKIAGPLFRIRRCVDMLAEGKDVPPIRLRKRDEFKELAAALDKLRGKLKDQGLLKPEEES